MKRITGLLLICSQLVISGQTLAFADIPNTEEPFFGTERASAVMNIPSLAISAGKEGVNTAQPAIEQLYDLGGEWRTGISAALYTFKSNDIPLVAVRAGYIADYCPYVSAPIDIKSVSNRYILPILPDKAEDWLTAGPLEVAWIAVGKYGVIGPWIGYNADKEEDGNDDDGGLVGGVSVGAKLTF